MRDVVEVRTLAEYRLQIKFDDGVEGQVDVAKLTGFRGVFEPLRDLAHFRRVFVHPELKVVCWPNGADLDPDVLYSTITGKPIEVRVTTA